MAINWEKAPEGTTHYFEDSGERWWLKAVNHNEAYFLKIGVMHDWSGYTTSLEELADIPGATLLRAPRVRVLYRGGQPPVAQQEVVVQEVPKKSVGWW